MKSKAAVMPLNLINDRWIPVKRSDSGPSVIRPDEISDPGVIGPNWPRADLNIACWELLIGLIFLADPPGSDADWEDRRSLDSMQLQLREKLSAFSPAFNLTGDLPLFLQDFEALDGEAKSADMLFIDSAGVETAEKNADIMVWRNRYPDLDLGLAAMALYALQAYAPSGGRGNLTSMREGSPMVTLIDPGTSRAWDLVWANVPNGKRASPDVLPWMKPTRTSKKKGSETYPKHAHPAEAFFGMPRRLRLLTKDERVTGVIQRPYGTKYMDWRHPLTPYRRDNEGSEFRSVRPEPGAFGFRNWLGIVIEAEGNRTLRQRATIISDYQGRLLWKDRCLASVIVAGWAMDKMKPLNFILSHQPLPAFSSDSDSMARLSAMIQAAESFGSGVLRPALKIVLETRERKIGETLESLCESFFIDAQQAFDESLKALTENATPHQVIVEKWVNEMKNIALTLFDRVAIQDLSIRSLGKIEHILKARESLYENFAGRRKPGSERYGELGLSPHQKTKAA